MTYAHATFIGENPAPGTYDAITDKTPRQGQRYFIVVQHAKAGAVKIIAVTRKKGATMDEVMEEIQEGLRVQKLGWVHYENDAKFKQFWSEVSIVPDEDARGMLDIPNMQ